MECSSGFSRSLRKPDEPVVVLSHDIDLVLKPFLSGLGKLVISLRRGSLGLGRVKDHHLEAGFDASEKYEATSDGRESDTW